MLARKNGYFRSEIYICLVNTAKDIVGYTEVAELS